MDFLHQLIRVLFAYTRVQSCLSRLGGRSRRVFPRKCRCGQVCITWRDGCCSPRQGQPRRSPWQGAAGAAGEFTQPWAVNSTHNAFTEQWDSRCCILARVFEVHAQFRMVQTFRGLSEDALYA